MEYDDHVKILANQYPDLAGTMGRSDSIENVLNWMEKRSLPPHSIDMIAQDEFSYDFLINLQPENRWLVFGVN